MRQRSGLLAGAFILAGLVCARPGLAIENVTYTYDALGRLVQTSTTGGSNNGVLMQTCFDRAGNRLVYATGTSAPTACPTPGPTPSPSASPTPTPPPAIVTATDYLTVPTCANRSINVVANDTDPSGNYPLTVTAVSYGSNGYAVVTSATSIRYGGNASPGGETLTYTVQNAVGTTGTGVLDVTIVDQGGCN